MTITLHSSRDLGAHIRDLRADVSGAWISDAWCRDQMHALGVSRYEDLTEEQISAIADRVDSMIEENLELRMTTLTYPVTDQRVMDLAADYVRGWWPDPEAISETARRGVSDEDQDAIKAQFDDDVLAERVIAAVREYCDYLRQDARGELRCDSLMPWTR